MPSVFFAAPVVSSGQSLPATLRVLLVDDHEDANRSMVLLLKRRGYHVEAATCMASARALAERSTPFDVLIADVGLPDGDGVDLLATLEPRPRLGGIVVTGLGACDCAARAIAAGYSMHLCKPVDVSRLDAAIQEMTR